MLRRVSADFYDHDGRNRPRDRDGGHRLTPADPDAGVTTLKRNQLATPARAPIRARCAAVALADVEAGKAALRRGDYAAAYRAFLPDAEAGDFRMI